MDSSSSNWRATTGGDASHMLSILQSHRLLAVLREPSVDSVVRRVHELVSRGIALVEVTTTTPGWADAVAQLLDELPRAVIGVGTLTTPAEVERAADGGASFLMSPGCDERLLEAMPATGLLALPGCATPSEIMSATRFGARAVKLFPACSLGIDGLRALRGPFSDVPMVVSGGISSSDVSKWLEAGAMAVAMGAGISTFSRPQLECLAQGRRVDTAG